MLLYTGSYTRLGGPGIGICAWEDGRLRLLDTCLDLDDPIWLTLSPDKSTLFACGCFPGTDEGAVACYQVDQDALHLLSVQATQGRESCHMALHPDGVALYTANYDSGSISVLPVRAHRPGEVIQLCPLSGSGPVLSRQEAAHAHQCVFRPGTYELFVCDLGSDSVMVYAASPADGRLRFLQRIAMPPGMGPRHLVFEGADRFYVTGELDNVVRSAVLFQGVWQISQALSALPDGWQGESATAAIRLGRGALYVSNRGHDSLCRITLSEAGEMTRREWISTRGHDPRDFVIADGKWFAANQSGGGLTVSGGAFLPMDGVVCIVPFSGA